MGGVSLPPWSLFGPGFYRLCGRVNGDFHEGLRWGGLPHLLPTPTPTGDSPIPISIIVQSPVGSLLLFSGFLVCARFFVPSKTAVSLSPSPINKSLWPLRSDSLEILSPFVGSPGWEAWCGIQNLYHSGRTSLVLLFSSLWVTQPVGMGFDCIVIVPLPLCQCGFFVFERGVSFFLVGSSILLLMVV